MGGLATWMAARHKGKSDMVGSQAAMIKAAQDAATQVIASLQAEIKSLRDDREEDRKLLNELDGRLKDERAARQDERQDLASQAAKAEARAVDAERRAVAAERRAEEAEARCADYDGKVRALQQQLDSLQRQLGVAGVDMPAPAARRTEPILLGEPEA
jgi:chromosome segregation ATPase